MPKLRLFLFLWRIEGRVFFHLDNESDLGWVAEVSDCESTDFLDEGFTCKLELVLSLFDQVFNLVWLQLHNASDAELWCPLSLIEVSQNVLHICALLACQIVLTIWTEINEKLVIIILRLDFILCWINSQHTSISNLARLVSTPLALQLGGTWRDSLLFWDHALF